MAITEKQKELDKIKWEKSVMLGFDACGTFDYCKFCDKGMDNPCEIAHDKLLGVPSNNEHEILVEIINDEVKEVEEKPKKTTKKTTSKSTTKKSTASKTTTKKSTKTTTKKSTK